MIRTREIDTLILPFGYLFTCCRLPCQWPKSTRSSVPLDPAMTQSQAIIQGQGTQHILSSICTPIGLVWMGNWLSSFFVCWPRGCWLGSIGGYCPTIKTKRLRRLYAHQALSRIPLEFH